MESKTETERERESCSGNIIARKREREIIIEIDRLIDRQCIGERVAESVGHILTEREINS